MRLLVLPCLHSCAFVQLYSLRLVLAGDNHELGLDECVKLLLGEGVELHGALLEGQALLVRILGDLAGHVVANLGVEAGDEHKTIEVSWFVFAIVGAWWHLRLLHDAGNLFLVSLQAGDEVLLKRAHAVGEDAGAVEQVADDQGLVDVELKLAVHAANSGGDVVAHDLGADHGQGLALGGVDLAGHDAGAGLVLGEVQLAEAAAGAGAEVADVLGNLGEGGGDGVEAAVGLDNGVVGGEGLKLVGGGVELGARHLGHLLGNGLGEALKGVDAGADGGAALGEQAEVAKRSLDALDAKVELGDVAGKLLGEGEGSGVLQMGAANLDNLLGLKVVDLGLEGGAEAAHGGKQLALEVDDGGDVHDGGEGVVGRGGAVDVVVGVDGALAAHLAAENLNSAVGDDLVGVHVGLGAGAGLPDDEGEVVHELAVGNLLGGLLDSLADLGVCKSSMLVGLSVFVPFSLFPADRGVGQLSARFLGARGGVSLGETALRKPIQPNETQEEQVKMTYQGHIAC